MARTRDPRPSSDGEEQQQFTAQINGHESHRVYEENELSAAEALMGFNASPTTSHPTEPRSASTSVSSNNTTHYLLSQRQGLPYARPRSHSGASAVPSASSRNRKRNRGRSAGIAAVAREEALQPDTAFSSTGGNGESDEAYAEHAPNESNDQSDHANPESGTGSSQIQFNATQRERLMNESKHIEHKRTVQKTSTRGRRKRKRSSSVSIAAISRGQIDGTVGLPEVDGEEHKTHEDLTDPPIQTQSEPEDLAQSAGMQLVDRQQQNEGGGPSNPDAEVSGTNGPKVKPRNFDRVVFGQWVIKTWYFSPYPISNVDDDNMSTSAGPSRQSAASSGTRTRPSKGGNTRGRTRSQNTNNDNNIPAEGTMLWVCEKCFKYMQDGALYELHSRFCDKMHPPGRKVYQRGAHIIYEIDGAKDKLFCQNLSLFGKLFIDIKTLFFDCDNFMFYVLTEADRQQDHVIGFFSKEKVSYDDYNLACIITFPPYQRMRYGVLMIEFSYYLSRKDGKLGTPERPLSELGLRTYLTFWTGQLVQFFRRVLSVEPLSDIPRDQQRPVDDDLIRFVEAHGCDENTSKKRKKNGKAVYDHAARTEIWDSRMEGKYNARDIVEATSGANDALYSCMRWMRTTANKDGSATTHVFARCTLQDIANATGIRTEDIAFTLHECGLLQRVKTLDKEEMEEVVIISREMVEEVAERFKVKSKMCMELQYCLI